MSNPHASLQAVAVTIQAPSIRSQGDGTGPRQLLVIEAGSSAIFPLPDDGEVIVGRAPECQLRLRDPTASRQHARLVLAAGVAMVDDLGSRNGTWVNGEQISSPRALSPGDVLSICDATLLFRGEAAVVSRRPIHADPAPLRLRLEEEVDRALTCHRPLALVALGLAGGSREELMNVLDGRLRIADVAAWQGADRLLLLMPDLDGQKGAEAAQRLLSALPGARAGIASCPADGGDADVLLVGVRAAMEAAAPGQALTAGEAVTTLQVDGRAVVLADPAMIRLYQLIERLSGSDLPVLVCGETGAGKEIAVQTLHLRSRRHAGRLISLNCAALPESLAESELFGHERGAFSGAVQSRAGALEAASGGTLFLDEIGELPLLVQAKLLRALETRRVTRLGDTRERAIDIRIVAATNRDLAKEAEAGRFRQDLYFRLGGAVLVLPPLRQRPRELPILARTFLQEACARGGRMPLVITPAAMQRLLAHSWPGNLRELRNLMDYVAATVNEEIVEPWHFEERVAGLPATEPALRQQAETSLRQLARALLGMPVADKLGALEEAAITEALEMAQGNKSAAARLLGLDRKALGRRLDKKE